MSLMDRLFGPTKQQLPHEATGHIYAVRVWRLYGKEKPVLCSRFRQILWPSKTALRSESRFNACAKSRDILETNWHPCIPPNRNCTCGIYAGKPSWTHQDLSLETLRSWAWLSPRHYLDLDVEHDLNERTIAGVVALWGKIVEHSLGYRAEYAYPVELLYHEDVLRYEPWLSETYGTRSTKTTKENYLMELDAAARRYTPEPSLSNVSTEE